MSDYGVGLSHLSDTSAFNCDVYLALLGHNVVIGVRMRPAAWCLAWCQEQDIGRAAPLQASRRCWWAD